jgi:hypothetical protein
MRSRSQRSDESADDHLILLAVPLRQREWMAADCGWRYQRHHPPYGLWSFRFNFDIGMPVRRFFNVSLSIEPVAWPIVQIEAVLVEESLA